MSKITKQNVGGTDYTMVGCALTGVCASAAGAFIKAVTLSDGDEISDGMTVIVTFANGNTAGTAPASKTIYSSDQVNYYEDTGLTVPFTLAPAGCYEITYTGEGNAYTYISYPVIQIGNITGVICDASGNTVSGSLWAKGAQIGIMFKDGKFLLVSGALLNNMSALPTDAVLHYSFDEVPDLPDGTADVRYLNGNTYGVSLGGNGTVTTDPYAQDNKIHKSNVNGNANFKSDISTTASRGIYISFVSYGGKTVILDILVKTPNLRIRIESQADSSSAVTYVDPLGVYNPSVGRHRIAFTVLTSYFKYTLIFYGTTSTEVSYTEWELLNYYIGDGSYTTPVIDNANGQWNSTSQSGVAIQGVSGKGYKQFSGLATTIGKFNFGNNLTVSIWVNPETDENGLIGDILFKSSCIRIRNGFTTNNYFYYAFWNSSTSAWQYLTTTRLLPKNTWTHVVITKNGTTVKLYLNGVLSKISTIANDISVNNYDFNIGSTSNTRPQSYDDLLIFDRALSEAEVTALYLNRANTPKYYPVPTDKIEQNNWGLATSGGVFDFIKTVSPSSLKMYAKTVPYGKQVKFNFSSGYGAVAGTIYMLTTIDTFEKLDFMGSGKLLAGDYRVCGKYYGSPGSTRYVVNTEENSIVVTNNFNNVNVVSVFLVLNCNSLNRQVTVSDLEDAAYTNWGIRFSAY